MRFSSFLMFSCASLGVLAGANAYAQDTTPANDDSTIGDIVVTAQRRAESIQDVPIAVTAMSAEQMDQLGLVTSADLTAVIPGVTMNPGAARSPLYVRGVGNNTYSTSPSVLTFIDGVYQPFDNSGADYSNVERIELAKGPQGTLFGRNATGGVIQVITKNPFDWQGLEADIGVANFSTTTAHLYGSTLLSDRLAADVAVFYDNQEDGWGVNRGPGGGETHTHERFGLRSKWVFRADPTFTATVIGDYADRTGQTGLAISPSTFNRTLFNPVLGTTFTLPSIYDIQSELQPYYQTRESGLSVTLDKTIGEVDLLSISAYRHVDEEFDIDFDGNQFAILRNIRTDDRDSFSQEFQVSGETDHLTWVGGLYYYWAFFDIDGPHLSGAGASVAFGVDPLNLASKDTTHAYAGYAQATLALTDNTNLTLGGRYTLEEREIVGRTNHPLAGTILGPVLGRQSETFEEPSYRVALDHHLSEDVLIYASWNRSFNAGFFNQLAPAGYDDAHNAVVDPEILEATEIGIKTDLLDNRLRFNLAAFYYDYANLQQSIYGPFGIVTLNAAGAEIQGADLEIIARPIPDLTLSLNVNYLDTEYTSYPGAPDYDFDASGAFHAVGQLDAAGNEIVQAPPLGVLASATYTHDTDIGTFDTTLSVNYQDRQYADPQNELQIDERTLIGLNERWTSNDGNTFVMVWGKNLTDEEYDYSFSLLEPAGPVGNPAPPRTYGVTVGRTF